MMFPLNPYLLFLFLSHKSNFDTETIIIKYNKIEMIKKAVSPFISKPNMRERKKSKKKMDRKSGFIK